MRLLGDFRVISLLELVAFNYNDIIGDVLRVCSYNSSGSPPSKNNKPRLRTLGARTSRELETSELGRTSSEMQAAIINVVLCFKHDIIKEPDDNNLKVDKSDRDRCLIQQAHIFKFEGKRQDGNEWGQLRRIILVHRSLKGQTNLGTTTLPACSDVGAKSLRTYQSILTFGHHR